MKTMTIALRDQKNHVLAFATAEIEPGKPATHTQPPELPTIAIIDIYTESKGSLIPLLEIVDPNWAVRLEPWVWEQYCRSL